MSGPRAKRRTRKADKGADSPAVSASLRVSAPVLGKILGLTARRIRQYAEDGKFPRAGRGLFDVSVCVPIYLEELKRQGKDEHRAIDREHKLLDLQMRRAEFEEKMGKLTTTAAAEQILAEHAARVRGVLASAPARYVRWFPELPRPAALKRLQELFDRVTVQLQRDADDDDTDATEEEKPAA